MANEKANILIGELEGGLKDLLNELIDGSVEDLDGPIRLIAQRMAMAARRQRMDLVEMSKDQLQLIVLEKELRIRSEFDGFWQNLLNIGINALISGAIGGLGRARV
jgi:hypothetical protein